MELRNNDFNDKEGCQQYYVDTKHQQTLTKQQQQTYSVTTVKKGMSFPFILDTLRIANNGT